MTNNEAEYRGLLAALERAAAAGAARLVVTMDSELVIRQMLGSYKVRHPRLRVLHDEARRRGSLFAGGVEYHHAPRETEEMQIADDIANGALDAAGEA